MKFNCAYTELVDIHKLQPNPKNPNRHPDKQIKLLSKIIDYQGQRAPIVVSKRSAFITKGHGRLEALKALNWTQAAVDYQDYDSEAQEYADMIADNKIAELAEHDDLKMIDELRNNDFLKDFDLELMGLDDFVFDVIENAELDLKPEKELGEKQYILEAQFPNEMELQDYHDDLLSRGYMVKIK